MNELTHAESTTGRYINWYSGRAMDIRMRFRVRVADLLEQRGLKQKALSADKSEGWISNIMTGRRGVRLQDLESIAGVLGVPPSELIRAPEDTMIELTATEGRIVEAFRRLSPTEQQALLTVATLRYRKVGRPAK